MLSKLLSVFSEVYNVQSLKILYKQKSVPIRFTTLKNVLKTIHSKLYDETS